MTAADNEELDALVANFECDSWHYVSLHIKPYHVAAAITALRARVAELERDLANKDKVLAEVNRHCAAWESQLQQVKADAERERDFIRALFDENDWPGGGDLDQFAFQDLAVKHGLLREETRTEPCGEACHCAEYHGSDEMKDGVTCYRKVEWLMARRNDGTA